MTPDHDLHVHTYLSACCEDKERHRPPGILALAGKMGVRTIGFADHLWMNPNLPASNWYRPQDKTQISRLRADLADVSTTVRVLVGCEAETVAPGKFSVTAEFARTLDFVLLACSHFHINGVVAQPESRAPRDVARHMLAFFRSAVSSGLATSIPHPFVPFGYLESFDEAVGLISDAEFADAFGLARDRGVAIEITTCFIPPGPAQFALETPVRLLSLARQAGCKFTFGTDAHDPERQKRLPELAAIAQAAGVTEEDVPDMLKSETCSR